jgi:hypothetical protein
VLEIKRTGTEQCWVEFSPALSLRTQILGVQFNGKPLPIKLQPNSIDQHLSLRVLVSAASSSLIIHVRNDFGLSLSNELPALGSASRGLRVLSESWNVFKTQLTLEVAGRSDNRYALDVWNPSQISTVDGAVLTKLGKLVIQMPHATDDSYSRQKVVIRFGRQ